MRRLIVTASAVVVFGGWMFAQKAPEQMVFEAKPGNVLFLHHKHSDREKQDCTACHPKLWPQSKAPLNYKAAVHKASEAKKESCGACHVAGGKAFASAANCKKCHGTATAATKKAD